MKVMLVYRPEPKEIITSVVNMFEAQKHAAILKEEKIEVKIIRHDYIDQMEAQLSALINKYPDVTWRRL